MEDFPAEEEPNQSQEPRRNKSYTTQFKLQVIKEARETSKRAAARRFGVDAKRVWEWVSSEDKLCGTPRKRRRMDGAGRKPSSDMIDEEVLQWVRQLCSELQRVTRKMVMREARRLHASRVDGLPGFVASEGWLRGFMTRNGLSLRMDFQDLLLVKGG